MSNKTTKSQVSNKKEENTMDLAAQVKKLLGKMKVLEKAVTRKGSTYNILAVGNNDTFWDLWKEYKEQIKALGVVVGMRDGDFIIRDFTNLNYDCSKKASKQRAKENLSKAREVVRKNRELKTQVAKTARGQASDKTTELAQALKILRKYGISLK